MLPSLLSALIAFTLSGPLADDPPWKLGPSIERRVTLTQEISCESGSGKGRITDIEVTVAVPQSNERQKLRNLNFSPAPARMVKDEFGNTFAVFRKNELRNGDTLRVGWTASVRIRRIEHRVEVSALKPLSATPEEIRKRYLRDGPIYCLDDRRLKTGARRAARGAKNSLDLAFRLNEYVRKKICYLNDGRWDSAPVTLANGHGSCSEYNFLFMSLCRLNGLAARYVGASAFRGDGVVYRDTVHHRWSEVFLPGHGWFPVDVARNDGEDGNPVNGCFGTTSRDLLVTMKGDGGSKKPLEWGYVARLSSNKEGDAVVRRNKSFLWEPATRVQPAAAGTKR